MLCVFFLNITVIIVQLQGIFFSYRIICVMAKPDLLQQLLCFSLKHTKFL